MQLQSIQVGIPGRTTKQLPLTAFKKSAGASTPIGRLLLELLSDPSWAQGFEVKAWFRPDEEWFLVITYAGVKGQVEIDASSGRLTEAYVRQCIHAWFTDQAVGLKKVGERSAVTRLRQVARHVLGNYRALLDELATAG